MMDAGMGVMGPITFGERLTASVTTLVLVCVVAGAQNLQAPAPQQQGQNPAPQAVAPAPQQQGQIPTPQAVAPAPGAKAPTPASTRKLEYEFAVSADKLWTDTGVDLQRGDRIVIDATGALQSSARGSLGPEGMARSWGDLLQALPVRDAGRTALIGRIGAEQVDVPFLVGLHKEFAASRADRLYLGFNDTASAGSGSFHVKLKIIPVTAVEEQKVAFTFAPELLSQVPRRVADAAGNEGDMVNFILVGDENTVLRAFGDAGWVRVDRTKAEGVVHAVLGTLSKQSYTEMPMSDLYAFGRPQDYGFAHAEPVSVVMTRHHLRVWKAPFEVNSLPVWIGAATHDIGFEKDQRNGKVTHKIDPKVDDERSFVEETFNHSGNVSASSYVTPSDPVRDARTATGGTFSSDGRIVVLLLRH
jgi:hypothetical protein